MTFADFSLNEQIFEGIASMGFNNPTPIQAMAIPVILTGRDLIACAQTGTGKTAAYLLPMMQLISTLDKPQTTTLVLVPTRELAQQIDQQVQGLAYFTNISSIAIFGGGDGIVFEQQRRGVQNNTNIIIATPGRLLAMLNSGMLKFNHLQHLILDEADRMLDMGFFDDIMRIMSFLPQKRQTLLFSATMPPHIHKLTKAILTDPEQISLAISQPAAGIDQQVYHVYDQQKTPLIKHLLSGANNYTSIIIFAGTKEKVKELFKTLQHGHLKVKAFHSDLKQAEREEILLEFKNRQLRILIGTDVLSRGIDVEGIDLVVNYDVPPDPEDYIHRIGRTARAASKGTAITLVNERDQRRMHRIEALIGRVLEPQPLLPELGEAPVFKPLTAGGGNGGQRRKGGNFKKGGNKKGHHNPKGNKPQNQAQKP